MQHISRLVHVWVWASGLPWRESLAIGTLMHTRGLMELVVITIGLEAGVITPTVFTLLVLMAMVTTLMTTPLLAWLYLAPQRRQVSPKTSSSHRM